MEPENDDELDKTKRNEGSPQPSGSQIETKLFTSPDKYTIKGESSSGESSDEGQDIYIPPVHVPSINFSHLDRHTSPDSFEEIDTNTHCHNNSESGHDQTDKFKGNVSEEDNANLIKNDNISGKLDHEETDTDKCSKDNRIVSGFSHNTNNSLSNGNNSEIFLESRDDQRISIKSDDTEDTLNNLRFNEQSQIKEDSFNDTAAASNRISNFEQFGYTGGSSFNDWGKADKKNFDEKPVIQPTTEMAKQISSKSENKIDDTDEDQNKKDLTVEVKSDSRETKKPLSGDLVQNEVIFSRHERVQPSAPYDPNLSDDSSADHQQMQPHFGQWGQYPNIQYPGFGPYMSPGMVDLNRPPYHPPFVPNPQLYMAYPPQQMGYPRIPKPHPVKNYQVNKGDNPENVISKADDETDVQKPELHQNIQEFGDCQNESGLYPKLDEKKDERDNTFIYKEDDGKLYPKIPQLGDSVNENASKTFPGSMVVITFSGEISEHTLKYYFENTRKSGGGEIKSMDFSPDTGVVVIQFEESGCSHAIYEKNRVHKVSGIDLVIHVIDDETDIGKVIEENMVFVRGIKESTSRDCLMDYFEVKAGYEPTDMMYGANGNCAIIVFEDKIDFPALKNACSKKPLEGSYLTVGRVAVTSSIMVSGIKPDVSRDTVQFYFENQRRSGGDEGLQLLEFSPPTCVIRFPSPEVAKRVCDKKDQKISDSQLEVSMHYEFFQKEEKNDHEELPEIPGAVILSADIYILKFLKNSPKVKEEFENLLQDLHARVEWAVNVDKDSTKIVCDLDLSTSKGQNAVKSWKTDVDGKVKKFLSEFTTMRVTTLAELWRDLIGKLRTIEIPDPESVCVIVEKNNNAIILAGEKKAVKELCYDVQRIVKEVEENSIQTKQTVNTRVLTFKIYILQLLWRLKCFDEVKNKYPGVEAICSLDKREVTLSGPTELIQAAELFLRQTADGFPCITFRMSQYKKDLLLKKGAREIWNNEMKTKQIIAAWNVEKSGGLCEMYADTQAAVERAKNCMEDLFLEDEFIVDEDFDELIESRKWQALISKLEERDEKCFVITTERQKIQMAAVKYIFHEIKSDIEKEIKEFAREHCTHSKTIHCDKGVYLYIRFYNQREIQKIEAKLKEMGVKITGNNEEFCYKIEGNLAGISEASKELSHLMKMLHSDKHKLDAFGIRDYFLTQSGKRAITDIGKKNSSVVLLETEYSEDKAKRVQKDSDFDMRTGAKKIFYGHKHKICLVKDDITKLPVDAIVNAANNDMDHAGGIAYAIAKAAGKSVQDECYDYVKSNGRVCDGDAMTSSGGRLPCKMIIHAVGPMWKDGYAGEEQALQSAIEKCLRLTDSKFYESVAIPALSGGIFGYPVNKCTSVIVRTIKRYFEDNLSTSVKTVYLCDINIETIQAFNAALQAIYINNDQATASSLYPDFKPLKYPGNESSSGPTSYTGPENLSPLTYPSQSEPPPGHERTAPTSDGFIQVIKGLLTDRQVDVMVNSINQDLDLSHGRLSKSILKEAGSQIQTEIYSYLGNFRPGIDIAVTSGGNLKCHAIFHGVLGSYRSESGDKILQHFVIQCMKIASEKKYTSIAFPAIGTGVLGFPADIVAKTMFDIVSMYKQKYPDSTVNKVEFVIYPKDFAAVKAFEDEFEKMNGKKYDGKTAEVEKTQAAVFSSPNRHGHRGRDKSTKLGEIDVLIKTGDITKETTDVVINCTSKTLDLTKGAVSKAILSAAGDQLQTELKKAAEGNRGVIVTSGGNMRCKHIFHIMAQHNLYGWEAVVAKCLQEAEHRKLSSMSLPALGTGYRADKPGDVASAIFSSIKRFSPVRHLKQVSVVVFQKEMAADFISELKKIGSSHQHRSSEHAHDSRRETPDRNYTREERNSESIRFYIWSDSWDKIKSVKRDLDREAESQCHKKTNTDFVKVVNGLKDFKIFQDIEKQHKVKITNKRGVFEIEGQQANVSKASDALMSYFRKEETRMADLNRAKDIANYVQWFYKDPKSDKCNPFKLEDNCLIETEYKKKSPTVRVKDSKGMEYKIDFQKMEETCRDSPHTKIPVQRRLKEKGSAAGVGLPSTWVSMSKDKLCHEEQLHPGNKEYDRVKAEFQKTGGSGTIVKIYRVQNPTLYMQYGAKKKELYSRNGKNPERWLWHGTSADTVDFIIHRGFNRSYCGKNGTAYGNGVYFAVQANLSVGFCSTTDNNGHRHIFSTQVLTGEACAGRGGMTVLPPKSGNSLETYDSASDNPSGPSMFIIFHDSQAYPTYHILFQ